MFFFVVCILQTQIPFISPENYEIKCGTRAYNAFYLEWKKSILMFQWKNIYKMHPDPENWVLKYV